MMDPLTDASLQMISDLLLFKNNPSSSVALMTHLSHAACPQQSLPLKHHPSTSHREGNEPAAHSDGGAG